MIGRKQLREERWKRKKWMSESKKLRLKRKTERRKSQKSLKRLIKKRSKNESRTNLKE